MTSIGPDTPYPHLFSPLAVGARTVSNRIVLPATLTNFGTGNRITDRWTAFLVERARGGAGLVVSEVVAVDPNAIAQSSVVTGFDAANADGFARTADGVHEAGALLVAQLWHPGRQQLWHPTLSPMGVSDQPDAYSWTVPHVMDEAEIRAVVAAYVSVAERLAGYGLDGVELHGAHGYLLTQFLSPWSNTRDDAYGGTRERRARVVREIVDGIRTACGPEFVIGLKMPGDEGVAGGIDVEEAAAITAHLSASCTLDYFAYGQGNFSLSLETHVPDSAFPPAPFIDIHRRMRKAAGAIPVVALGRIGTPELAERVVAEGYGDLVGMSRALIADAAFGRKAAAGNAELIRPSAFDNWCWGEIHAGRALREYHNPHLAEPGEAGWTPPAAARPRHVVVVGAGPGGLETAWVAAARGHRVTLLGASPAPGGKLALEAALPGREELARVIAHQVTLATRHGAAFRLAEHADAASIRALDPDVVVLATGAALRPPPTLTAGHANTLCAHEYVRLLGAAPPPARRALLFDMDQGAGVYALADAMAAYCEHLILMTPRPQVASRVNYCSAIGVHRRLYTNGVEIIAPGEPLAFEDGVVRWTNPYTGAERTLEDVDLLVYATPRLVHEPLGEALAGHEVHRVGDCQSPRDLMAAIHGGHALALTL